MWENLPKKYGHLAGIFGRVVDTARNFAYVRLMNSTPLTLSVRDAALATSLSEYEIRDLVNRGTIPARRNGRRILIDFNGLQTYIRSLPLVVEQDAS
jgi:excisionase family DNA binding protein